MTKKIDPKLLDQAFEGIEIPDDKQMAQQVGHAKRLLNGWLDKVQKSRAEQNSDPEYKKLQKQWFDNSYDKRIQAIKNKWQDEEYRQVMAEASRKKAQDPNWLEKVRANAETRKGSEEWSQMMSKILKEKYADPEQRKKITEVNRKKAQDPEIRKKLSDFAKERAKDPEYIQKLRDAMQRRKSRPEYQDQVKKRTDASIQAKSKPIMTRHGAFLNKPKAAEYYQVDPGMIGYWMKKHSDEFYFISKDDYEKLKDDPKHKFSETYPHPSKKKSKQLK
jgi:hypothetical protein